MLLCFGCDLSLFCYFFFLLPIKMTTAAIPTLLSFLLAPSSCPLISLLVRTLSLGCSTYVASSFLQREKLLLQTNAAHVPVPSTVTIYFTFVFSTAQTALSYTRVTQNWAVTHSPSNAEVRTLAPTTDHTNNSSIFTLPACCTPSAPADLSASPGQHFADLNDTPHASA